MRGKGIYQLVDSAFVSFRQLTHDQGVSCGLCVRVGSSRHVFSTECLRLVAGGLLSGTFGCANSNKDVAVGMHRRGSYLLLRIISAKVKVARRGRGGVFRHFCRIRRNKGKDKVKLSLIGGLVRLRRKAVALRDRIKGNSRFSMCVPRGVIMCERSR